MRKLNKLVRKITATVAAVTVGLSMGMTAFAATVSLATIDTSRTGSMTIYKYDQTTAEKNGVTDSYVASGEVNTDAENTYKDYAIQGVEFTYLKIGEIATHSVVDSATGEAAIKVIYGLDSASNAVMQTIGLDAAGAVKTENGLTYYISDSLIDALAKANQTSAVATKDTLEEFITANSGTVMPETDAQGKTGASGLPIGLYLVVETAVPENVTVTTAPFLVSLPMTDLEGEDWVYDVTVYPKNLTGDPDLKKEVAEVTSGADPYVYATAVTASSGDVLAYQITSTLPLISSKATYLTTYTFSDTIGKGLSYNQAEPITMTWRDANGTVAAIWQKTDGKFTVTYGSDGNGNPTMVVAMTKDGLAEINPAYSQYTVVIDYTATVNQNSTIVMGDEGNGNDVVLTWKRSNTDYYDTLNDTSLVYTFGVEILKLFSDGNGDATQVEFKMKNEADGYYLTARKDGEGVYYLTGTVGQAEEGATVFSPAADGTLKIYGLEADTYVLTELATDEGYTLLKDNVRIQITANYTEVPCVDEKCTHSVHQTISATATVNSDAVSMRGNNAIVPLSIVNERGYEVPATGDSGTFMLPLAGMAGAAILIIVAVKKREQEVA